MKTSVRTIVALSLLMLAGLIVTFETPATLGQGQAWKSRTEARLTAEAVASVPHPGDLKAIRHHLEFLHEKGPLRFEANGGQFASEVKFASRGANHTLFLTSSEAELVVRARPRELSPADGRNSFARKSRFEAAETLAARLKFLNSRSGALVSGVKPLSGRSNYFIGNDPRKWRTDIVSYAGVRYQGIYPGIDLVYYGNEGQLEYDFIVSPGADPGRIALAVESIAYKQGASHRSSLRLDASGDLVVGKDGEEIRFQRPVVYQEFAGERRLRDGRYELKENGTISFVVGSYDMTKPLIIDPVLTFSTFLGGSALDRATAVAVDSSGNIYVTGETNSADFPTVGGVPPNTLTPSAATCGTAGCPDVFVTKLDPTGSTLLYSTYIGGSGADGGYGITVDGSGNAFVTGYADSDDFPTTSNAYQQLPFLGQVCKLSSGAVRCDDAFVVQLNAAGNALSYSSYLSTVGEEYANAIAIDSAGNAYITGYAASSTFPVSSSAYQKTLGGGTCGSGSSTYNCGDTFVAKFNPAATGAASLVYATYLGGNGDDVGFGIAVDSSDNAYVTGTTVANATPADSFPTTAGAFQGTFGGVRDAFVTELNSGGSALVYSTFLGGSDFDEAHGIALDTSGNVYIAGLTASADFPKKLGAFQPTAATPTCASGLACFDAFVAKINPHALGGFSLVYSTYLGGSEDDRALAIAVDSSSGNAYVTGGTSTKETDPQPFPLVAPLQGALVGNYDVFVTELNSTGSALVYSTYLGGTNFDAGFGIAVDSSGAAVVAGRTSSSDFPFTLGVVQTSHGADGGNGDAFVAKISPPAAPAVSLSSKSADFGGIGVGFPTPAQVVDLRNVGSGILNLSISISGTNSGDFAETNTCGTSVAAAGECTISLTFTPSALAARSAQLTITDNASGSPHQIPLTGTGTSAPAVTLSPTSLDFGFHLVATPSSAKVVTVSNTGTATLTITGISTSSDYGQTNTCTAPVPAGGTCQINVTFTPAAVGTSVGQLQMTDNAPGSPQSVALSGTGANPGLSLAPTSLAFGSQLVATTSTAMTVTVDNAGPMALTLSSIAITGTNSGDFSVASSGTCSNGLALAVDASCTVNVTFAPTATGARTGTLSITITASGSTSTVSLTGTGTVAGISLSPTTLSFGNQLVGTTSAAQTVTVTSNGTAPLSIATVTVSVDFAKPADTCTGASLAPGSTCTIGVRFAPTAAGSRTGTLTINDNAPGNSHTVALSGTGTQDFALTLKTNSPAVNAGSKATYTITFTPAGGFNQNISVTCTGAPKAAACSVSPNPRTMGGTNPSDATVSVTTTARSQVAPLAGPGRFPQGFGSWTLLTWLAALLLMLMTLNLASRRRRVVLGLAAMLLVVTLWSACGGGGGGGGGPPPTQNGTPAGTYTLTVTATSGGLTHTLPLTLKVN